MAGGFRYERGLRGRGNVNRDGERETEGRSREREKEEEALSFLLFHLSPADEGPLGHQLSWAERREAEASHHHGYSLSRPQLSRLILLTPNPSLKLVGTVVREQRNRQGSDAGRRRGPWGESAGLVPKVGKTKAPKGLLKPGYFPRGTDRPEAGGC